MIREGKRRWDTFRFSPYVRDLTVSDTPFRFLVANPTGREWYDGAQLNCAEELSFLNRALICPGDVVIECGAHHGFATVLLSRWVGQRGSVLAVEPNPENFRVLNENVRINKLANTRTCRAVVAETQGSKVINSESNSSVKSAGFWKGNRVDSICLDDYAGLKPNVLKIDVEGYEVAVLRGGAKVLSSTPKLAIEIHTDLLARYGSTIEELFELIGAERYDFWIQWDDSLAPQAYLRDSKIRQRVHLFCIPKTEQSKSLRRVG
jgi:FkbM family methyltransferase